MRQKTRDITEVNVDSGGDQGDTECEEKGQNQQDRYPHEFNPDTPTCY